MADVRQWIPIILGFLLVFSFLTPTVLGVNLTNQTSGNKLNETFGDIRKTVRDIDWNKYARGTIGFAFFISNTAYQGFQGLALMFNVPGWMANAIALTASTLLFLTMFYALGRGVAKILQSGMKYAMLIVLVIMVISFLYGLIG